MLKLFGKEDKRAKEKKAKNNNNVNEKRPASAQSSNGAEITMFSLSAIVAHYKKTNKTLRSSEMRQVLLNKRI
ncbi:hypothetical protein CRE_02387 [Caenorhabditis remanei]|uniref:Uncharacterized protein n=1 Tax=Caenorhabditis remanei TaxID=31234 RepID=E3MIK0_CAERE|nr:hypothetical protein CRE_02387 [Caenorhabditis remanei]